MFPNHRRGMTKFDLQGSIGFRYLTRVRSPHRYLLPGLYHSKKEKKEKSPVPGGSRGPAALAPAPDSQCPCGLALSGRFTPAGSRRAASGGGPGPARVASAPRPFLGPGDVPSWGHAASRLSAGRGTLGLPLRTLRSGAQGNPCARGPRGNTHVSVTSGAGPGGESPRCTAAFGARRRRPPPPRRPRSPFPPALQAASFPSSLPALVIVHFLHYSHASGCEVIPYCGFWFAFP